ncbi:HD domain-containing protein [Lachnospiraceae bacterium YH-ros2228]
MKELEKNERYSYSSIGHPASRNPEGFYYCRAVESLMADDYVLCRDCPLYGGNHALGFPECWYYDLDLEDAELIDPEEFCQREHSLVESGLIPHFPFFLTDAEAQRRFGLMEKAIQFAAKAHLGQKRKGNGLPYICHPIEVMMLVARMTPDPEVAAAAALHDTLEDTDTRAEDIREHFGDRVLALVQSESEDKRPEMSKAESWQIRKEETLAVARKDGRDAKIIMLADKLSNLRSTYREWKIIGDQIFDRFNVKDKARHAWYARGCMEVLQDLSDLPQYREFCRLVETIYS